MCKNNVEHVTRQDIFNFLLNAYFGSVEDPIYVAANSAYLDLNRTIEFKKAENISEEIKESLRTNTVSLIKKRIQGLSDELCQSQDKFDIWHSSLCTAIIKNYADAGIQFHYGQAQKWVNMAFKYLTVINHEMTDPIQRYMHIPVDSIVIESAAEDLNVERPLHRWSRMDENEYKDYQTNLCMAICRETNLTPMLWEFRHWNR